METLNHYTVETGDNTLSPRSQVSDEVVEFLQKNGMTQPGIHEMSVIHPDFQGWQIHIELFSKSYIVSIIYQGKAAAEILISSQIDIAALSKFSPDAITTPAIPYLIVRLDPSYIPSIEAAMWMGDFERCIAWALLEK